MMTKPSPAARLQEAARLRRLAASTYIHPTPVTVNTFAARLVKHELERAELEGLVASQQTVFDYGRKGRAVVSGLATSTTKE